MSVLLRIHGLGKAFGPDVLFEDFSFSVGRGDRVGLIGPNGAGKSTLLKMMAGIEPQDEGDIVPQKGLRMNYVPQMAVFKDDDTVLDVLIAGGADVGLAAEMRESEAHLALGRAGFTDPEITVGKLSGGWKKRLTLARGLLGDPDLILLDEPTNHLDTHGVLWLEDMMRTASWTWLLVTHDRLFLERTAARVVEINRIFPEGALAVDGGYRRFQKERAAFLEQQQSAREALANKVRREADWLSRQPKARTTKAKYRVDAAHALIEELEQVKTFGREQKTQIAFDASERKTKKLIEAKGLTKSLGDKLIVSKLDLVLSPGNRTGLMGTNGSGKTTLLRLLLQDTVPDAGSVRHAPELKIVYFDQIRAQLDPETPLKDALSETGDSVLFRGKSIHIIAWAKRFRFKIDQLPMPVGMLSGGEQARVLIAKLVQKKADILLLDEPTNDLDIPTLELLEESLLDFPGAVVMVTHDRFMLERVCNRYIGLDGTGKCLNFGDYEQWEKTLRSGETPAKKVVKSNEPPPRPKKERKKLSYNEQREWDGIEDAIMYAEENLESLQNQAADPTIVSDHTRLMELHEQTQSAQAEVDRLYARWEELSAKVGDA